VKVFNHRLRRQLERFKYVQIIEVTNKRELYTKHGQHLNSRGKETMANGIVSSIEKVFKRKVDPINMEGLENKETDCQKHIEPTRVKNGTGSQELLELTQETQVLDSTTKDNQELIEFTQETSILDSATKDNHLTSNTPDKSDCLETNKSVDKNSSPEKIITTTDGNETNRSSNRTKKTPSARYSDFLWEI
jgi:hypothetical protein